MAENRTMKEKPALCLQGMAREFVRESIIEDAATRLIVQIMTEVADAHIAPRDAEIASLRAQLDEAKCKIEELGTHCALHESLAHGYTDEIAELQCRVDEARRKAIEDAAKTAEAFAKNHGVQWGDRKRFELHDIQRAVNGACGLIAEDIRSLLSESKT